jgi:glycerol kinase
MSIDQGTTSSRAMLFTREGRVTAIGQKEYPQIFPESGWVEQDAVALWQDTLEVCRKALSQAGQTPQAIGITNQRETVVVWERATGKPVYNAIVWQDRRTEDVCKSLRDAGHEATIRHKTGLRIDPYFSATKLAWILGHVEGARAQAEAGKLAAGTVDSYLLWHLTKGRVHATDATNASRTLLFNTITQKWDDELLQLFEIPRSLLPKVQDSVGDFGCVDAEWFGKEIPIYALVGDQQSATVGQACFAPGMWKSTYGTGCFVLMHSGAAKVESQNQLLATVATRMQGEVQYALEGSIFVAGAAVKWLRDQLGLITHAADTAITAQSVKDTGGVYVVPAFAGLGAPHWDSAARGAIVGMTLDTQKEHIIRATLEAVAYQTRDLLSAFQSDMQGAGIDAGVLRVDGGMVANDWFCQFLADILDLPVERPQIIETTALGAAYLAGMGAGIYDGLEDIAAAWRCERRFEPAMPQSSREQGYAGWQAAIGKVRHHG